MIPQSLAKGAFAAFDEAKEHVPAVVVTPAVPILYFGDLARYEASELRVVTVGLNPSLAEFPAEDPFARFASAQGLTSLDVEQDYRRYESALNQYFHSSQKPYVSWFSSLEPLLQGAGSSYYPGADNCALHTDLCSPVATNPTWSRLGSGATSVLGRSGRPLWHELIRYLRPHVIFASVARAQVEGMDFAPLGPWSVLHTVTRQNPYMVQQRRLNLGTGASCLLVFGRAAQKPFALIDNAEKTRVGQLAREQIDV